MMENYTKIAIIITFFSLWLSGYFSSPSQQVVGLFLIFSLGILHGSNDLKLISKVTTSSKPIQLALFIGSYIGTVLIASLLFYSIPSFALVAFVIFSAYHFGEQHFNTVSDNTSTFNKSMFLSYGLTILFLLFNLNSTATVEIINSLTGFTFLTVWFKWIFTFTAIIWLLFALTMVLKNNMTWKRLLFELFLLLVFAVVFKTATLIWAFAIYFIFWHSIPSIFEQQSFLYGEVSIKTFIIYIKSSFVIWLISITTVGLLFLWIQDEKILLPLMFAFLGAITFAHSFTISKMFMKKAY
ncbi:MAG: Brp/Blh family beta-carotene 15,15'-monooxygenase [Planctomycetota bacterium]|jgi:Brp/Blh family beta-carotene 15,15'-monooxygenase|uniref:Brp/Blh family beta-carotene 15,15'-dioxygenase n=1 Tax=Patiriisocius sp. Uisw_047 TaxID=3230969 RepID=UPI0039EC6BB3